MTNQTTKEIGIALVTAGISLGAVLGYRLLLPYAVVAWPYTVVLLLIVLFWQAVLMVSLALARRPGVLAWLCLAPPLIVILVGRMTGVAIGGAALLALFSLLAARTLVRDEANRVMYRTADLFLHATRLLTMGTLIALTSLAWPVLTDSIKSTRFVISEQQVAPFLKPIEPIIQDFFPGYTAGASIDDLLDASLAEEKAKLPPGVIIDPVQEQQMREDIKRRFGKEITGQEGLAAVAAGKINEQINSLATQNPVQASLLLIVLVFLTLRALLPFIVWPTLFFTAGIVKLAVLTKLAELKSETVTQERLRL